MNHFYQDIQGWFNYGDLYSNIIRESPDNFKFAEIGVWKGRSLSYFMVEAINSQKNFEVYAIDTFLGSSEHKKAWCYQPILNIENGLYNEFLNNLKPVIDNIKIIRKPSVEAAELFQDGYFDAVFIDASHDYNNVMNDLRAWFPKVKKLLYGHDIDWEGVKKATTEFAIIGNCELSFVSESSYCLTKKI